ncbi:hypothetical protein [Arenibacter sp. F20364]|uniref:hypothetical protein n=1 Tax=Arenibacter sp. F20364 TaxID=2926415 RepID=UPI001FF6C0C7|nr:hypothetical protein [Arenibacter sp. F20364]MCK0190121.1 hypothetical protein [Arenibacter sp. F20364]
MELSNIEKLLERYFEATATVAEEEMLREYFTKEDVPLHLKGYAPMFQYFSVAKEERFTRQVPLKPRKRSYVKWISVAAVSILVFGIYFGRSYQEQKEAEYAYQETKKALSLLATNLGKGTEKVAYLKEFEETKQKIYNRN